LGILIKLCKRIMIRKFTFNPSRYHSEDIEKDKQVIDVHLRKLFLIAKQMDYLNLNLIASYWASCEYKSFILLKNLRERNIRIISKVFKSKDYENLFRYGNSRTLQSRLNYQSVEISYVLDFNALTSEIKVWFRL